MTVHETETGDIFTKAEVTVEQRPNLVSLYKGKIQTDTEEEGE